MSERSEKRLKEALLEGEQVLWEEKTGPFSLLSGKEGRSILIRWIISTVAIAGFTILRASSSELTVKFLAIMIILLGALLIAPIVSYRQLLGQRYYLTDRRAIVIKGDGTTSAIGIEGGVDAKLFPLDPGVAIAIGAPVIEEGGTRLRWRALHAKEPVEKAEDGSCEGLVFYNVARADEALRILNGG